MTIVLLSFVLSDMMSLLTSSFVESAGFLIVLISLIALVFLGILTDVIGTAVTSVPEQPFIAMASKRIAGARQALYFVRKAERVSSLLNDVNGDIVVIISGSAGSVIEVYLVSLGMKRAIVSVLITAFASAFMIGGKAYGKRSAIQYNDRIILWGGQMMAIFKKRVPARRKKKKM